MHFIQLAIAFAVFALTFWFERWADYPINPVVKGAWAFIAAYGITLGYVRISEWLSARRF